MNRVGAVIVRYRGGEETARCLASLAAHAGPRLERTVLVDSGSGDGGAAALATRFPGVEVIELAENRSFAWAAGVGAERIGAPYLLLLNPDTEMGAGSLDRLAAFLDGHPGAAGVVPLLVGADGRLQYRWQLRRLPGPWRLALGLPGRPAFRRPPTRPRPVPQPAAACWLLRREVWAALGGLDPVFAPAWWEDVDFCARLAAASHGGFWVEPAARVMHIGGSSVASLEPAAFLTAYAANLVRYARRHHPGAAPLIRLGVGSSFALRGFLRPCRRAAYREARRRLGATLGS